MARRGRAKLWLLLFDEGGADVVAVVEVWSGLEDTADLFDAD